MTQPITCPACHRLRPQDSPGASFWVTAVSSHRRRRTLVDLRPSAPSVPPGQPDRGRHGCGEPPATPPATPPDQFTVSSTGNEGALSPLRFSGAGEDVAMEDALHLQAPAGVRTRTELAHSLHTPPRYTGRKRTTALSRYRRGSD